MFSLHAPADATLGVGLLPIAEVCTLRRVKLTKYQVTSLRMLKEWRDSESPGWLRLKRALPLMLVCLLLTGLGFVEIYYLHNVAFGWWSVGFGLGALCLVLKYQQALHKVYPLSSWLYNWPEIDRSLAEAESDGKR